MPRRKDTCRVLLPAQRRRETRTRRSHVFLQAYASDGVVAVEHSPGCRQRSGAAEDKADTPCVLCRRTNQMALLRQRTQWAGCRRCCQCCRMLQLATSRRARPLSTAPRRGQTAPSPGLAGEAVLVANTGLLSGSSQVDGLGISAGRYHSCVPQDGSHHGRCCCAILRWGRKCAVALLKLMSPAAPHAGRAAPAAGSCRI